MKMNPSLKYGKCESEKVCRGGSLGRWLATYYNGTTKRICDQCLNVQKSDIREYRAVL